MMGRRHFAALILLTAAGALALRLPLLNQRPMHGDEAVHAVKFAQLWETGRYVYDPQEFHGPTLYYFALPVVWLSGAEDFGQTTKVTFRIVPVLFGVGLILLLGLVADGLGRAAAICAGVLTALSPALVFYSRYYIQETLLVFFTFAAIGAGWRYVCSRRVGWALLAGACVGLMHATKETCVVAWACMAVALCGARAWGRWDGGGSVELRGYFRPGSTIAAVAVALVVSALFYSGFLTNLRGPLDSLGTYATYFARAGGNEWHLHPWYYYLRMLLFTRHAGGPWWSEGLILGLAAVGIVHASKHGWRGAGRVAAGPRAGRPVAAGPRAGRQEAAEDACGTAGKPPAAAPGGANVSLLRFLSLYAILMTLAYATIPYKTPWCLLEFLHPLTLLAGVGAAAVIRRAGRSMVGEAPAATRTAWRRMLCVLLLAGAAQLGWQGQQASFRFYADHHNPYVYAHPLSGVEKLTAWVEKVADVHPAGRRMLVKVITSNEWPLPWYLRRFERVGYWAQVPEDPDAPLVIVSDDLERAVARRMRDEYQVSSHGLRPDVVLFVHVQRDLYEAFAARAEARTADRVQDSSE